MMYVSHSTNNLTLVGNGLFVDDCPATRTQYQDGSYAIVTYWKPSPEDLECLNSNGLIKLHILTPSVPPPVALETCMSK